MSQEFNLDQTRKVTTQRVEGITSSAPAKIHKVPEGSAVKIYPTSAGTATVYSTQSPRSVSDADDTNAEITGSTNTDWSVWEAGAVTTSTLQKTNVPVETIALTVTSGTWVLEVTV